MTTRFFSTLWTSLQPAKYHQLRGRTFGSACWYLARLLFIQGLMIAGWFAIAAYLFFPIAKTGIEGVAKELPGMYPEGLVVTVQSGALSINRTQPVRIEVPQRWATWIGQDKDDLGKREQLPSLLVIDPTKGVDDYDELNTYFLFTKTSFIAKDDKGGYRVIPWKKDLSLEVTRADYVDVITKGQTILPTLERIAKVIALVITVMIPFFAAGFGLLGWMLINLLIALLMLAWSAILKRNWMYGQLYTLCMFGATPIVVLRIVAWLIPGMSSLFPSWLGILWMAIVVYMLPPAKHAPAAVSDAKPKRATTKKKPKKTA